MDRAKSKNEYELRKFEKPLRIEIKNREYGKSVCKKMKSLYDSVLYGFMIIGIDIFEKKDKRFKAYRCIMRLMHYIMIIVGLVTGTFHFGLLLDKFDIDIVCCILYINSGMSYWFYLNRGKKDYAQMLKVLSMCKIEAKHKLALHKMKRKSSIINALLVLSGVLLLMIFIIHALTTGCFAKFPTKFSIWSLLNSVYLHIGTVYGIALFLTTYFCSFLPVLVYSSMYTIVSWHLKIILNEMKDGVLSSPLAFRSNHKLYNEVRSLIEFVDSKTKYTSCFSVLHLASFVYFIMLSNFLKDEFFDGYRIVTAIMLLALLISTSDASATAGEFPAISSQILHIINELPLDDTIAFQRIIFTNQIKHEKLFLTVGGIIPLTKSWPLALIGTIMTYSVLIKTL